MSIYSKCWSDMYALYHKCISDLPADFKNNLKKKLPKNQLEKYYQQYFYEASLYYIKDLSDKGYLTPSALCDEFMGAQLFKKEQKGEIQNIYLSTKELKDFLFETPIKSIDGIKEYIKLHGEDSEDVVDGIDVINKAFLFNLHVPQEINGFTCRIWVQEDDAIIVWIKYDKLYVHWRFDPDNNYAEDLYRLQKCEDKEMKYPVQMILNLIYFIIPAVLVIIVASATGLFSSFTEIVYISIDAIANETTNASMIIAAIPKSTMNTFTNALSITLILGIILFILFSFLSFTAQVRFAKTGSGTEGLRFREILRDISKVGLLKMIVTLIVIYIIALALVFVIGLIGLIPYIGVFISIFIGVPYVVLYIYRAIGLLYADA